MSLGRILLSWSGGKDSVMALHEIQEMGDYEIVALLTTVTDAYHRVSMHGFREELLERQAESVGLRLHKILIPQNLSNEEYEAIMKEVLVEYKNENIHSVSFGDIFLEDLRKYREENLAKMGMKGIFPIWKRDTGELVRNFIDVGFRAVTRRIRQSGPIPIMQYFFPNSIVLARVVAVIHSPKTELLSSSPRK